MSENHAPIRRGAVIAALFPVFAAIGCVAGDPGSSSTEAADTGGCGTPLGDALLAAARSGASTLPAGLEWRKSRVVGEPHVGGAAIADAMVELVRGAEREVLIEFYELDERSWLASRLKDAIASLGPTVQVRILVNPAANRGWMGKLPESTQKAIARLTAYYAFPNVTVGAWQKMGIFGAMHTKAIVVDGRRALVSDANLQANSDPTDDGGLGWFQMAMVVEGDVAWALRSELAGAWKNADGDRDVPDAPPAAPVNACTRMITLGREATAGEDASADRAYGALFRSAQREVHAITPNLNDDGALAALADATANVDVYLVLSKGFNDFTESLPGQGGTNAHNVDRLAGMAKNACNLHIRWFAQDPGVAVDGNGTGASHSKWASADGHVMILGSQNLDTQSWKGSRELSLAVDDARTTGSYDLVFRNVWDRSPVAYECP